MEKSKRYPPNSDCCIRTPYAYVCTSISAVRAGEKIIYCFCHNSIFANDPDRSLGTIRIVFEKTLKPEKYFFGCDILVLSNQKIH
jgi:hypothetical protein